MLQDLEHHGEFFFRAHGQEQVLLGEPEHVQEHEAGGPVCGQAFGVDGEAVEVEEIRGFEELEDGGKIPGGGIAVCAVGLPDQGDSVSGEEFTMVASDLHVVVWVGGGEVDLRGGLFHQGHDLVFPESDHISVHLETGPFEGGQAGGAMHADSHIFKDPHGALVDGIDFCVNYQSASPCLLRLFRGLLCRARTKDLVCLADFAIWVPAPGGGFGDGSVHLMVGFIREICFDRGGSLLLNRRGFVPIAEQKWKWGVQTPMGSCSDFGTGCFGIGTRWRDRGNTGRLKISKLKKYSMETGGWLAFSPLVSWVNWHPFCYVSGHPMTGYSIKE